MPHLLLQYSTNIRETDRFSELFAKLHTRLVEVGGFRLPDFKSRAQGFDDYLIGDGSVEQAFVNLDLRIFPAADVERRKELAEAAADILEQHFTDSIAAIVCDISVQVTELERGSYARRRSSTYETATGTMHV